MISEADIANRFKYHKPANETVAREHEVIRERCFALAKYINETVPDGREKALAITKLEEVMMWSNAGIARNDG